MSKLTIRLLAAALTVGTLSSPAFAQNLPTAAIEYSDLDLGSPAGVSALNRRIERAAERLCQGFLAVGPHFWSGINFRNCVRGALASARPQVDQVVARANGTRMARATPITITNGR